MLQKIFNIIAPDDCLECGLEGSILCEWCRLDMEPVPSRCYRCHRATAHYATCNNCRRATGLRRVLVCYEYKDVAKDLVAALKFESKRQAASPIARSIEEQLPLLPANTTITSVPTAPLRVRQRGFDHAKAIAKELAKLRQLNYEELLFRKDNTRQVGMPKRDRRKQALSSYVIKQGVSLVGKEILLIDDVVTTGSTVSACAKQLHLAGAEQVLVATLAYSK